MRKECDVVFVHRIFCEVRGEREKWEEQEDRRDFPTVYDLKKITLDEPRKKQKVI